MLNLSDIAAQNARAAEKPPQSGAGAPAGPLADANSQLPVTNYQLPAPPPPPSSLLDSTVLDPERSDRRELAEVTPHPSVRTRSTLPPKILLAVQPLPLFFLFLFFLRSPIPLFRHLTLAALILTAAILALAAWSHFLAKPFRTPKPTQRPPHFSPPLFLGTISLFLAALHLTLYYSGHPTHDTILFATASWAPISLPLQSSLILAYSLLLISLGVALPKSRTLL